MARINIETKLWTDPRFQDLMIKVGSRHAAKGMVLELFTLAQEYWFPDRKPIPVSAFARAGLAATVEVELAVEKEGGVYCVGSEDAFSWLFQKQDAGKKSAEAKKQRPKGPKKPKRESTHVQRPLTLDERTSTSLSSSSSFSSSISESSPSGEATSLALAPAQEAGEGDLIPAKGKYSPATRSKMRAFMATYAKSYREKYGGPPEKLREPAIVGKIGTWIEGVSEERACQLAQVFLQVDYRPINESCHDPWLFFRHLNRIGNALATGKDPGAIDWAKVFT